MNHLDLFSGIGGFSLAASWVWGKDHNIIAFVEQDKYCQKVLNKHWPDVPIISDIKDYKHERIMADTKEPKNCTQQKGTTKENGKRQQSKQFNQCSKTSRQDNKKYHQAESPTIDLLTGGFPCQPFSVAGKRKGKEDDRFLWHQMLRIIKESMPIWIIGENVTGIVNMELDNCITDLEGEGYETQTFIIPACAVDARHKRDRVWIVGNSNSSTMQTEKRSGNVKQTEEEKRVRKENSTTRDAAGASGNVRGIFNSGYEKKRDVSDNERIRLCRQKENKEMGRKRFSEHNKRTRKRKHAMWDTEPAVGRVANGIPSRVDRLKGLGNAILPQVVYEIMKCISTL